HSAGGGAFFTWLEARISSTRSRRCARLSFLRAVRYFGSCLTTTPSLVAAVRAAASVVRRFSSFSTSGLAVATSSGAGRSFLAIFFGMVALRPPCRGAPLLAAAAARANPRSGESLPVDQQTLNRAPQTPAAVPQPALREADAVRLHHRFGVQADPF